MVEITDIREETMKKGGWQQRSILDEPRLSEAVQLYEEMGFEVMVNDIRPEDIEEASSCTECISGSLKVIYTRKREGTR